ncbi:MAG: hypothetical protein K2I08_09055 [Muribaculaceae bacterium]|nr:hypothetical protein [Muribaculaceae bacterium]
MKKRIILLLVILLGVLGVRAQDWRGIIELHGGIQPGKSDIGFSTYSVRDVWNPLSFGLNYSMGAMVIPQVFVGVGIGGYTSIMRYTDYDDYSDTTFPALYFPVFFNARWIPDMSKNINPYVDLKIGYQMGVDLEGRRLYVDDYYSDNKYIDYEARHKNGIFLQPGVGFRFGKNSAFNLGIAYNFSMRKEFVKIDTSTPDRPVIERIDKNFGSFMLTFGTDF